MLLEISEDILKKAQKGNLASFEHIVFVFERPIFSYLFRIVSHKQTAEDLTQETFVKIFKNLKNIKPKENFKSWVFTIATHSAYDYLRKVKRKPESFILDDPESGFETIEQEHTYTMVEKVWAQEEVEKALTQVKPEYKSVLLLFYKEDLTYESIARILKLPINTVKTHLHRAKKALKEHLEDPNA